MSCYQLSADCQKFLLKYVVTSVIYIYEKFTLLFNNKMSEHNIIISEQCSSLGDEISYARKGTLPTYF